MKKKVYLLLSAASGFLLAVSWVMSFYAYSRLPQETAPWRSLWTQGAVWSEKSLMFFFYPLAQTFFLFLIVFVVRIIFFRQSRPGNGEPRLEREKKKLLLDLKKEVVSLGLIFINLIFIHLQTSLILLSHRLGQGINRFYFYMLIGVILMLIPYYHARRKMLLK